MLESVICCCCLNDKPKLYFIDEGHHIRICTICNHVYESPISLIETHDSYESSGGWVDNNNKLIEHDITAHPRGFIYQNALDTLLKYNIETGSILEIGCSVGHFLSFMKNKGYECHGVEPGRDAIMAKQIDGIEVSQTYIEDYTSNIKFKAIFLLDVLEHIPNPHLILNKIYNLLSPGGIIYAIVPNFNIQKIRVFFARLGLKPFGIVLSPGNHINHFSPFSLRNLFNQHIFNSIDIDNSAIDLQYIRGLPFYWKSLKITLWKIANLNLIKSNIKISGSITVTAKK